MNKATLGLTVIALTATASQASLAQSLPPVRQLGPVTAVAKEPLGAVTTVRHLPDGRVLVNDIVGRRVVMFDSAPAAKIGGVRRWGATPVLMPRTELLAWMANAGSG